MFVDIIHTYTPLVHCHFEGSSWNLVAPLHLKVAPQTILDENKREWVARLEVGDWSCSDRGQGCCMDSFAYRYRREVLKYLKWETPKSSIVSSWGTNDIGISHLILETPLCMLLSCRIAWFVPAHTAPKGLSKNVESHQHVQEKHHPLSLEQAVDDPILPHTLGMEALGTRWWLVPPLSRPCKNLP